MSMSCCPSPRVAKDHLPELEASAWINSKPLGPKDLKDKVVLVYFFSLGEECSETILSHLSYLWTRMRGKGLVVLGVHTPSVEKEKDLGFVRAEAARLGIEFPLAVDNEYRIWKKFRNQFYSQFHFVDACGVIRHTRAGEGIEEEVEIAVVHLLNEAGKKVDLGPEIDGVCFEGDWFVGDGYVELEGSSGRIELRYIGQSLDLVISSPRKRRFEFLVDEAPLPKGMAGKDVVLEGGKSYLDIGEERKLEVVRDTRRVMRQLSMSVRGKGLKLMGFCVEERED
jgi:peroxiredoxin